MFSTDIPEAPEMDDRAYQGALWFLKHADKRDSDTADMIGSFVDTEAILDDFDRVAGHFNGGTDLDTETLEQRLYELKEDIDEYRMEMYP